MQAFCEWSRQRLQAGPCEAIDADLYAASLQAFLPVWWTSAPPDPEDARGFLAAHRRQVADDPRMLALSPHDFGRLTQAHETLLPAWDIERTEFDQRQANAAAAARTLILAEAEDERLHPSMGTTNV